MHYSILIYDAEPVLERLPPEEHEARLEQHRELQRSLRGRGQLRQVARLMPTTAAVTLRRDPDAGLVTDGPFAETKEQLIGFYVIECDSLEEAIGAAQRLPLASGCLEVRPISWLAEPG